MHPESVSTAELIRMLHDDAKHYDVQARSYLNKIDQLLTVAVAIVAFLVPVIFGTGRYVIGLFVPIAACFVLLFVANATGEMFALSAHRFRVEERLAALVRRAQADSGSAIAYTPWEKSGGQVRRHSLVYKEIQLFGLLIIAASIPGFAIFLWHALPTLRWAVILSATFSAVMFAASLGGYMNALRMYEETYKNMLADER